MNVVKRLFHRFLAWQRSGRIRRERELNHRRYLETIEARKAFSDWGYSKTTWQITDGDGNVLHADNDITPWLTDQDGETLIGVKQQQDDWPEYLED